MNPSIRADALLVALAQALGVVSGFVLAAVAADSIGRDGFAVLVWLLAILTYLSSLARFGSMQAAARVVNHSDAGRRDVMALLGIPLVLGGLLACLWFFALGQAFVARLESPELYEQLAPLIAIWLPAAAATPTVGAILRAFGRFGVAAVVGDWVRRSALVVPLLVVTGAPLEVLRVAAFTAIAVEYMVICVSVPILFRVQQRAFRGRALRPLVSEMRPFYLLSVVSLLLPQAGAWLLPFVADSADVADLGLALRFSLLFGLPFFIASRTFVPRIAKASAQKRLLSIEDDIARAAGLSAGVTMLGLIGFLLAGRWLTGVVFGSDFDGAFWPTVVLAMGALVNAATGLSMAVLSNSGDAASVSKASTIAGIAFVSGSLLLGRTHGALGVAVAALVAQTALNLVMARRAHRQTGVRSWMSYPRLTQPLGRV